MTSLGTVKAFPDQKCIFARVSLAEHIGPVISRRKPLITGLPSSSQNTYNCEQGDATCSVSLQLLCGGTSTISNSG